MTTPQLIEYIRGELAKGRVREDISGELLKSGGWTETDLSEAFRILIPMQGFAQGPVVKQNSFSKKSSFPFVKIFSVVILLGVFCFAAWFYRAPLIDLWNSLPYVGVKTIDESMETVTPIPEEVEETLVPELSVKDCGIGIMPDLKDPLTYEDDAVLTCLGESASLCIEAQAVLEDDLFPTIFQIVKNQDTCNFRLSYKEDSTLVDSTGNELADQYISCPIGIVKDMDDTKNPPVFTVPIIDNLGKYASQIYLYGTLGVFTENNVDKFEIQNLGCSGPLIDSIIASYQETNE